MPQPLETHADVLVRIGMMAIPGASHAYAAAVPVDPGFAGQLDTMTSTVGTGHDATGMGAANMADGGTVIPGPSEGGAFLDRPAGDFLAQSTNMQSLDISVPQHGMAETIKSIEGYSHLKVDGVDIDLMDYVPGGDIVQIMSGQAADPSSLSMLIAKHGFAHESEMLQTPHTIDLHGTPASALQQAEGRPDPGMGSEWLGRGENASGEMAMQSAGEIGQAVQYGSAGAAGMAAHRAGRAPQPDSDVLERDRGMLLEEHAHNLETSVASFDQSVVHTEMHAHGRTIAVDTHFEAHHPDNELEKHVADDHVHDEVLHAPRDETNTERPGMKFRTLVQAHLDAASKDEGMSI